MAELTTTVLKTLQNPIKDRSRAFDVSSRSRALPLALALAQRSFPLFWPHDTECHCSVEAPHLFHPVSGIPLIVPRRLLPTAPQLLLPYRAIPFQPTLVPKMGSSSDPSATLSQSMGLLVIISATVSPIFSVIEHQTGERANL
jgi:hypothetical protein